MYLSQYGLREEPFRLTPDPRFFHLGNAHRKALVSLLQGILQRKGFCMLAGPAGTGKTTLIHAALHILTQRFSGCGCNVASAILVNPTLTRDELLEAILQEFEIPITSSSKPRRLAALNEAMLARHRAGSTSVLVIDEAHLLSPELLEEIRLLGNAEAYSGKLLQIVLSGQDELVQVLAEPALAALQQRIAVRCFIRPLTLNETGEYIQERLGTAGLKQASPFSPKVIEQIHASAKGIPRLLNLLCDGCLSSAAQRPNGRIEIGLVEEVAFGLSLQNGTPAKRPGYYDTSRKSEPSRGKISVPATGSGSSRWWSHKKI